MEHLRWSHRPDLDRPVLIAGFEGWNDAGDAASTAVRYLNERWRAKPFADIDAEEFYDFTTHRPHVRITGVAERSIIWPRNQFSSASVPGNSAGVILLDGTEPALSWRTYCDQVIEVARSYGTQLILTCGALISDVPHSRPVQIFGVGYDTAAMDRLAVEQSTYEGPTGIIGVLHDACNTAGIPSASLWAAVPSYVHGATSPKAALALVNKVGEVLDVAIPTTDLEIRSAAYERQVNKLVENDDETAEIVRQLEERYDEMGEGGALVEEVEQFLRERNDE
ncbi:MAG: PAC2 family protein [Acidimicrobiia bacterium]|nr:PAC2 family protein [Acidimicrobiia bacterium]